MKKFKACFLMCLILVLGLGCFAFQGGFVVFAEPSTQTLQGEGTQQNPYLISNVEDLKNFRDEINGGGENYVGAYIRLEKSLKLSEIENWEPIKNFKGTFDGNGKTIEEITISSGTERGLFETLEGAKVYDLGVGINVVLSEEVDEEGNIIPNEKVIVGGICAKATKNTEISASFCNISVKATRKTEVSATASVSDFYDEIERKTNVITIDGQEVTVETVVYETYSYCGALVVGGIVGKLSESTIKNCYCVPEITITQDGSNQITSYFGSAVGEAENGAISNVYIAPTNDYISALETKNGDLIGVDAKNSPIKINSEKTSSQIVFGGIVGYASGVKINNVLFSSVLSSLSQFKIQRGGIIGNVIDNETFFPKISYSRFLNIASSSSTSNILSYTNGVGNSTEVGFTTYAGVAIDAMPTQAAFTQTWEWDESRPWFLDVEGEPEVWKKSSTISSMGLFFPSLQKFASFSVSITGSKEVSLTAEGAYSSGYYTLSIEGAEEKTNQFTSGQVVTLVAKLYSDGNNLHDFKNYFKFVNWQLDGNPVANIDYENESTAQKGYTVSLDTEKGETKLSFEASAQTEGVYTVSIVGRPVTVNVKFINEQTQSAQENIGRISKKIGNNVEQFTQDFSFVIDEYLSGVAVSLVAEATETNDFVFANKWVDANSTSQTASNKTIAVELNNEQKTSSARFYPTVVSTSEGLSATIVASFSNNTSSFTASVGEGGSIQVDGEELSTTLTKTVVNETSVLLKAISNEGFKFVGWFSGEELVSEDQEYAFVVSQATNIEAKFEEIKKDEGGLTWWIITLIVVCLIFVGGIITIIVVKVKKGGNSYRKKYKF